jgi:Zn-dependent M28 family amino/carboxypeptidase
LSLLAAQRIFQSNQYNFAAMKQRALGSGGATMTLGKLSMKAKNSIGFGNSYNICGYIEGHDTETYTVLSAHWDHLGSRNNTDGHKDIYRGAIDNGTGVAALLELARHFQQNKPKNNLLMCSFTAEEQGLLGAQYFVNHPPVPLSSLKGMLNFDCLNVLKPTKNVVFYGPESNQLYPLLKKSAAAQARSIIKDPNASKGYFYRSDHFPFIQKQVPSLLFMDIGISNPSYLANHYHQPTDQHDPSWQLDGFVQELELFKNIIEGM